MHQVKIWKHPSEKENQKTSQKRQSYDFLIENRQKSLCQKKRFEKFRWKINRSEEITP